MYETGGAIVGKIGVGMLQTVAPGALTWLKSQAVGKTILFVGPSRSGKTSFINFLRTGTFADPSDAVPRTLITKNTGSIQLKTPNGMMSIDLKKVIDTRGQDHPHEHAMLVKEHRPHGLCIILDANSDWSSSGTDINRNNHAWLDEFFSKLCEIREQDSDAFRRLSSFVIAVNKIDKISDPDYIKKRSEQIRLLASTHLRGSSARIAKIMNVKELSLLDHFREGQLPIKLSLSLLNPFVRD